MYRFSARGAAEFLTCGFFPCRLQKAELASFVLQQHVRAMSEPIDDGGATCEHESEPAPLPLLEPEHIH